MSSAAVYLCENRTFESCSPNSSSFCCNGVFSSSASAISERILPGKVIRYVYYERSCIMRVSPISVLNPVPITTPRHLPAAILVPYKTSLLFLLSSYVCDNGENYSLECIPKTRYSFYLDSQLVDLVLDQCA